jgi:hypothetical protein
VAPDEANSIAPQNSIANLRITRTFAWRPLLGPSPSIPPAMTRSVRGFRTMLTAVLVAACGESTPPLVATTVTAQAGTPPTGVVGTTITPAAIVSDQNGNPLSGVTVAFAITSGGGSLTGSATTTTDANGVATVSGWTLGTVSGPNSMTATAGQLPAVLFQVTATAGAPAAVAKVAGDNTLATPGTAVTPLPTVRVTDTYGNRVAGAAVTFAVTGGGGSVTGGAATSSASGDATVGSWVLGATPGVNTLTATAVGASAVTFTATGMQACTFAAGTAIAVGASTSASLGAGDCAVTATSPRFADVYTFTLSAQTSVVMSMNSAAVHPYLAIMNSSGVFIGESLDIETNAIAATVRATLPAGSYAVVATTANVGESGLYSLSLATGDGAATGCDLMWAARGIATSQTITASDCVLGDGQGNQYYADVFAIFLPAGAVLTVDMTSVVFDAWLDLATIQGNSVTYNDDANDNTLDARIVYTIQTAGYYLLFPNTALPQRTGAYQLTIAAPPAPGSAAASPAASYRSAPVASRGFTARRVRPLRPGIGIGRR